MRLFVVESRFLSFTRLTLCLQYLLDCNRLSSLPHVTFILGREEYTLTAERYVRRVGHVTLKRSELWMRGWRLPASLASS